MDVWQVVTSKLKSNQIYKFIGRGKNICWGG